MTQDFDVVPTKIELIHICWYPDRQYNGYLKYQIKTWHRHLSSNKIT